MVKGSCLCIGNHTRPAESRRPSTPTDVSQLDDGGSGSGSGNGGSAGATGLSNGAKAGIGVGAAVGGLALLAAGAFLFWRGRKGGGSGAAAASSLSSSPDEEGGRPGGGKSELEAAPAVTTPGGDVKKSLPTGDAKEVAADGIGDPSPAAELDNAVLRSELPG